MTYTKEKLTGIISDFMQGDRSEYEHLLPQALDNRDLSYGRRVFLRGLIEISSYCRCDCYYCGIRRSNRKAVRYRLSKDEILDIIRYGYEVAGFRSFVMQGGEDMHFTREVVCDIVSSAKRAYPDCAVTLSLGERTRDDYTAFRAAGADRYLLRHESATPAHYSKLHPASQTLENRLECLYTLKELGYQTGAGFMVGTPYQTPECLANDLLLLADLKPHMVGIGPFMPHADTPFRNVPAGSADLTLLMLVLTRIILPSVLLPATTALSSLLPAGRDLALKAGANVVMPSLTPQEHRGDYLLYNNKTIIGDETLEYLDKLKRSIRALELEPDMSRGDFSG